MSEFKIEVVRIGPVAKHPNADTLSLTSIHGGYPVIFQTGQYAEGDLAVYIPVEAIVPATEEWAFLNGKYRIRAMKLRGIFSMGVLAKPPAGAVLGQDVREALAITKYEEEFEGPEDAPAPRGLPIPKYDVEGYRRYSDILELGEEVVITEKLHGENARYLLDADGVFHVGSHGRWKNPEGGTKWAQIGRTLVKKFDSQRDLVAYGEAHGYTGGFPYGAKSPMFRLFDVFDRQRQEWLAYDKMTEVAAALEVECVPLLYRGPWHHDLLVLAEGTSTLDPSHVREGIVIRPVVERRHTEVGRVQFKYHGQGFLLRKGSK